MPRLPISYDKFGERLTNLVNSRGLSKKAFAEAINVSQNAVTNYLTKGRIPEPIILIRMSLFFKKSIDWLLQDVIDTMSEDSYASESAIMKDSMSEYGEPGKKLILNLLEDEDIKKALNRLLADVLQNIVSKSNENETKLKKLEQIISNTCQPPEGIKERRRCKESIDKVLYNLNQS